MLSPISKTNFPSHVVEDFKNPCISKYWNILDSVVYEDGKPINIKLYIISAKIKMYIFEIPFHRKDSFIRFNVPQQTLEINTKQDIYTTYSHVERPIFFQPGVYNLT